MYAVDATSSSQSITQADLRKLVDTTRQGTHWEGCWKSHKDCAILAAADRIKMLEERLLEVERAAEEAKRNHIERKHIDATPDDGYPLRVLRAYRADCDLLWAGSSADDTDTPLTVALNKMQKQRAAILDKAIAALAGEK